MRASAAALPRAAGSRLRRAGCTVPSTSLFPFAPWLPLHHGRVPFPPQTSRDPLSSFCTKYTSFRIRSLPPHTKMPIRLPTSANGMEPGAPYLRGTPSPPSQYQGPPSAPEPRTSLLEAEGRSQQGPGRKCVLLSGRPSPSSFRAPSFGESLRHLPKARKPANRGERDVAAPPFPRRRAKNASQRRLP